MFSSFAAVWRIFVPAWKRKADPPKCVTRKYYHQPPRSMEDIRLWFLHPQLGATERTSALDVSRIRSCHSAWRLPRLGFPCPGICARRRMHSSGRHVLPGDDCILVVQHQTAFHKLVQLGNLQKECLRGTLLIGFSLPATIRMSEANSRFFLFQLKTLRESNLQLIPADLKEYLKMLLNVTAELRPDAAQFAKIAYFDDVGVKTLNNLDSQFQWDNLQKSQFYKVHFTMWKAVWLGKSTGKMIIYWFHSKWGIASPIAALLLLCFVAWLCRYPKFYVKTEKPVSFLTLKFWYRFMLFLPFRVFPISSQNFHIVSPFIE